MYMDYLLLLLYICFSIEIFPFVIFIFLRVYFYFSPREIL